MVLTLEQKLDIFSLFELEVKKRSNQRIDYDYPASKQRGKKLATQLYKSGNGYVIGKYLSEEVIKANGYEVDPRGWINIMNFSSDELKKVIIEAMKSMSSEEEIIYLDKNRNSPEPSDQSFVHNWLINFNAQLRLLGVVQNFQIQSRHNYVMGILSIWEEYYRVHLNNNQPSSTD